MAPPPAAKNFQQHQPITTALRQICESYPAASCLRELLQNADDAGATEIEYVLDTKTYTDKPLLHPALEQYHGPALLARNNSVFSDEDFSSLSKIGDSRKRHEAESTGKFGQGFNSCYHWTDGPWIYSRDWLLLLDPHESWSINSGSPGGPTWNVIESADSEEIQNHMKTFQAVNTQQQQPPRAYDGTIVRIPLRTKAQAEKSKIMSREVTAHEIIAALSILGREVKQGGLLFLKHVQKMSARVDDKVMWGVEMLGHDLISTQARDELLLDFKALVSPHVLGEDIGTMSKAFQLDIRFHESDVDTTTTYSYFVQHLMRISSGDADLDLWARGKKLFSWVAIAAPLAHAKSLDPFQGRLFSILRLPIETNQPVHIHGLFSITPDRGRLSSAGQTPGYEDMETKWNEYMFKVCVADAWANLLVSRSARSWTEEGFGHWPRVETSPTSLWWTKLDDWVIDRIVRDSLSVWTSAKRCVSMTEAYFSLESGEVQEPYGASLASIDLPAVYLPSPLLRKAQDIAAKNGKAFRLISPAEVRRFLCSAEREYSPSEHSTTLLQYLLLDLIGKNSSDSVKSQVYRDIGGFNLWPMMDKSFSSLDGSCLLLPRDDEEMLLFAPARPELVLDLGRLPGTVLSLIREDIRKRSLQAIRLRTLGDLSSDWPYVYKVDLPVGVDEVSVARLQGQDQLITKVWKWIVARYAEEKAIPRALHELWLLPVLGNHVRQLTNRARTVLIIEKTEAIYPVVYAVLDKESMADVQVIDIDVLPRTAIKVLRAQIVAKSLQSAASSDHLETFLQWLIAYKSHIDSLTESRKEALVSHIADLTIKAKPSPSANLAVWAEAVAKDLRRLPLFSRMESSAKDQQWSIMRTVLDSHKLAFVAPKSLPCVLLPPDCALYVFSKRAEKDIQKTLNLAKDLDIGTLLFKYLVPFAFGNPDLEHECSRYTLADFVFENSRSPTETWVQSVNAESIIPLELPSDDQRREYGRLKDLVDPSSQLAKLYDKDEKVFPAHAFFQRHSASMVKCGLKTRLAWDTPLERARHYASCEDLEKLMETVKHLLAEPVEPKLLTSEPAVAEIRSLQWLPIKSRGDQRFRLLSPNECRGSDESDIIDLALGVLDIQVLPSWKQLFGWHQPLSREILQRQLDGCLSEDRVAEIDQVLEYTFEHWGSSSLMSKRCIRASSGAYLYPHRVCLQGSLLRRFPLAPHLEEIDNRFMSKHAELVMDMNIRQEPTIEDLLEIQSTLARQNAHKLSTPEEMDVMLSLLEIARSLPQASRDLTKFMIPDTEQILRAWSDVVFGDKSMALSIPDLHFAHPSMSMSLIEGLCIESPSERATRLEIEIDDDDDEYIPQEKLTTIIADTLGRYPIESTFGEFLANAEDCQASQVKWILDACKGGPHASKSLLNREMQTLQGPSLFAWNDQVFSEKDFEGYKDIGKGGKGDNITSIGLFGRGSMTMYHFTDSPMILSGGFLLMLDPYQRLLPMNKYGKRKIGVKLALNAVRRICPDQLTPFEGLGSYSRDMDHYQGTLFRMPLPIGSSAAKSTDITKVERLLQDYYSSASESLLFLKYIKNISFNLRGSAQALWAISADRPQSFEEDIFQQIKVSGSRKGVVRFEEVWRVGLKDIEQAPTDVLIPQRGAQKITECGIAACVSRERIKQEDAISWQDDSKPKFYCKLPTAYSCALPISVHASFAITGDRRSIAVDDTNDPSIPWNRWLLSECVPEFYIEFLSDLAPRFGASVFKFWPSSVFGSDPLSRLIHDKFWAKTVEPKYIDYSLYPLQDAIPLPSDSATLTSRPSRKRKLHKVTTLNSAQFDTLPERNSALLRRLLCSWCPSLVRPPSKLSRHFTSTTSSSITVVDAMYLCQLLKVERNCANLDEFLSSLEEQTERKQALEMLLLEIVPESLRGEDARLAALDGIRILPLKNNTLKRLKKFDDRNALAESDDYAIFPDKEEEKIFDFATDILIDSRLFSLTPKSEEDVANVNASRRRNPLEQLRDASFNIRDTQLRDIGAMVSSSGSPLASPNESPPDDSWFSSFWDYLNRRILDFEQHCYSYETLERKFWDESGLQKCRIYRVRAGSDHVWRYLTPEEFHNQACVLKPIDRQQAQICEDIEGLSVAERSHVLYPMALAEDNLTTKFSMSRFMKALKVIETQSRHPLKVILQSQLSQCSADLLRELLVDWQGVQLSWNTLPVCQELPIWPRQTKVPSRGGLSPNLAAKDAIFCSSPALLTPWTHDRSQFVSPEFVKLNESTLRTMGFHVEEAQKIWTDRIERFLPNTLSADLFDQYYQLIGCLASYSITTSTKVAPNGRGYFCKANELYDESDAIFQAAFREQEQQLARFVHPRFRSLRYYWISLGMRNRSGTDFRSYEDYLECTRAIDARWHGTSSDVDFSADALEVASYLSFEKPTFHSWSASTWNQIARVRMFALKTDHTHEPAYRQTRMRELSQQSTHSCLQAAGKESNKRMIWSQQPFLERPPAAYVYQNHVAKPSVGVVYAHVLYLMQIRSSVLPANVAEFLKDLQACYLYFQEDITSIRVVEGITKAAIWLNISTTDVDSVTAQQLQTSPLLAAEWLCINSPADPTPYHNALKFLIPYEKLLKSLGVHSVVIREREPRANASDDVTPSEYFASNLRRLRDQGKFLDVTFLAHGGVQVSAHRLCLAGASEYCQVRFSGEWGRLLEQNATIPALDLKGLTLQRIVDFAYGIPVVWSHLSADPSNNEIADRLDELLDLLQAADMWLMKELHSNTEQYVIEHFSTYVRPDNVEAVKKEANVAKAYHLEKTCADFIEDNLAFVKLYRDHASKDQG